MERPVPELSDLGFGVEGFRVLGSGGLGFQDIRVLGFRVLVI